MIKSTKVSTKFSNIEKRNKLGSFIKDYKDVMLQFVDIFWEDRFNLNSLVNKEQCSKVKTQLSARAIQAAGKQASAIVRGTIQKQKQRYWRYDKLVQSGETENAARLLNIINKNEASKPNLDNVEPVLDSRFVNIDLENNTSFDGWLTISSLYKGQKKLYIPFKRTKHFNNLFNGNLKQSIQISKTRITLFFEIEKPALKTIGDILGIDIGQNETISCSNGFQTVPDCHGHTLKSICNKLARCKKGSHGFKRAQAHRKNFIHWSINQLNLGGIKTVRLENIKNMRRGRTSSKSLSGWTYPEIFGKIEALCELHGVRVERINPAFTSQRCSQCGWTQKSNRNAKSFACHKCGHTMDADINASINISKYLQPLPSNAKIQHINKEGFYWYEVNRERIVPDITKS